MRVTTTTMLNTFMRNLSRSNDRLERIQQQLTTGKRLSRPSDDPPAVGRALAYRGSIAAGEQYLRTIDQSLAWLNSTDSTLDSIGQLLHRARELAVQGANDTAAASQRDAIAGEVDQIIEQLVVFGNASLRGQRLFAGLATDTDPFTASGTPITSVTWSGDTGQMLREFDVGVTMPINVTGDRFMPAIFDALIELRDDLLAGNSTEIGGADLQAIDDGFDDLLIVRGEVGARTNRLENVRERQELLQVRMTELLSSVEDVDMVEAISQAALQETVYRAALQAGAKSLQESLLDYLR